jgi:hypothetical protein
MATVGLKGGVIELVLQVGFVSARFTAISYDLLSLFAFDEYWAAIVHGGLSSAIAGTACSLSSGIFPWGIAAGVLSFSSCGAFAAEVAQAGEIITNDPSVVCGPTYMSVPGPGGQNITVQVVGDICSKSNRACSVVKWGNQMLKVLPMFVAVMMALLAKKFANSYVGAALELRCVSCASDTKGLRSTWLDKTVAAM